MFYDPAMYRSVRPDNLPDSLIESSSLILLDHITEPSLAALAEKVHKLDV